MLDFCVNVYQPTGFTEQGNSFICSTNQNLTNDILFHVMNHSAKDGQLVNFVDNHRNSGSPGKGISWKICKNTECSKPHTKHAALLLTLLKKTAHSMKTVFLSRPANCQYWQSLVLYRNTLPVLPGFTLLHNHSRSSNYTATFWTPCISTATFWRPCISITIFWKTCMTTTTFWTPCISTATFWKLCVSTETFERPV